MKVKGNLKTQNIIEYVLVLAAILMGLIIGSARIRQAIHGSLVTATQVVDRITSGGS